MNEEAYCVDLEHPLFALVSFPLHPITIQIREQAVEIVGSSRVTVPFGGVVPQQINI